MNKDYVEPMVVDENGNIYFSAKYLSENKDKEIERLNNIINELEKSWKEQQKYYLYRKDNRYRAFLSKNLDKLQELKGDSSNE